MSRRTSSGTTWGWATPSSQESVGTFPWSRGHGVVDEFVTVMAYSSAYASDPDLSKPKTIQYFSNPDVKSCKGHCCGRSRFDIHKGVNKGADSALTLRAVAHQVARWSPDPPDTDEDGTINFLDPDDDNDGLRDEDEVALGTNPLRPDTDGDRVADGQDAAPLDPLVSVDLPTEATKPANVIADFDDLSAIRADTARYVLTGVFADNNISNWSIYDPQGGRSGVAGAVRVGTASVSTWQIGGTTETRATGSIRINGVTLNSRYINFLMTGGGSGADVGMVAMIAGTNHVLAAWIPTTCSPRHLTGEENWSHFDMRTYVGQTVDLLIYDNDSTNDCGFVSLDHIYQSNTAQGTWRSRAPLGVLTGPGPDHVLPDLRLVCPCSVESIGPTGIRVKASVRNLGAGHSRNATITIHALRNALPVAVRALSSSQVSIGPLPPGGETSLDATYIGNWTYPPRTQLGSGGEAYLTLTLNEFFVDTAPDSGGGFWLPPSNSDSLQLEGQATLPMDPSVGGSTRGVVIEGEPGLVVSGGSSGGSSGSRQATLTIPKLHNPSSEPMTITRIHIEHSPSSDVGAIGRSTGWKRDLSQVVPAGGTWDDITLAGAYREPQGDPTERCPLPGQSAATCHPPQRYSHLVVEGRIGEEDTVLQLAWQTIETRWGATLGDHSFALSLDHFTDADGDGVSDRNEGLAQTNPNDKDSKPGRVTLDVMALYTPEAATELDGEPAARVIQWLAWGNIALRNSGVDAAFRLVATREVAYQGTGEKEGDSFLLLHAMRDQAGVFAGMDAKREAAGADLLVTIMHQGLDGGVCGIAFTPAPHGDYIRDGRHALVAVSRADCAARTLTHELGHNLGLGHSALQSGSGTWPWARGHGVGGEFVTIMAYPSRYNVSPPADDDTRAGEMLRPIFSNPDTSCGMAGRCGVSGDNLYLGADAASAIRNTMHRVARLSPSPLDTDGDGTVDGLDLDDDGDGLTDVAETGTHNTDPLLADTDGDGLSDSEEVAGVTDPLLADTDGDNVNDGTDDLPLDPGEWTDADDDGIGANSDINDNDASVAWTRKLVAVTTDASVAANLIATFDGTTEGPAAMRADAGKYALTGVFADTGIANWNDFDDESDAARVGESSVSTWQIGSTTGAEATGVIRIKGVTVNSTYINFLMAGGNGSVNGSVDVGVKILAEDTSTELAAWQPNNCTDKYLKGDHHWRHFDVSDLTGEVVDIEVRDLDSADACGFVTFDHFYQGAVGQGSLAGRATVPRVPATGVSVDRQHYIGGLVSGAGFENPQAMISSGWQTTGYFDNPNDNADAWVGRSSAPAAARVGNRAVSTCPTTGNCFAPTGRLTSPPFKVTKDYIRFLAAGGNGSADVGVRLEDTFGNLLRDYRPDSCNAQAVKGFVDGDDDWAWFDVSAIKGAYVRLAFLDSAMSDCGFISFDHAYQADTIHLQGVGTDAGAVASLASLGYNLLLTDPNVEARAVSRFDSPQTMLGPGEGWTASGHFANPASVSAWVGVSGAGRVGERAVSTCNMNGPGQCVDATGMLTSPQVMVSASYPYLNLYMAGGNGAADVGVRLLDAAGDFIPGLEYKPDACSTLGQLNNSHLIAFDLRSQAGNLVQMQLFDGSTGDCGYLTFDHAYMTDMALEGAIAPVTTSASDVDADGDGYPNSMDACPNDAGPSSYGWTDADGDGVCDQVDAFPNDSSETADADMDGVGGNRDADDANASLAYEARKRPALDADGRNAAKVVADFDDPAAMRRNPAKYELMGVFADPSLDAGGWNRFETEDRESGL